MAWPWITPFSTVHFSLPTAFQPVRSWPLKRLTHSSLGNFGRFVGSAAQETGEAGERLGIRLSSARITSAIRPECSSTVGISGPSTITRASGSVPEKRTRTRPAPSRSRSDSAMAFLHQRQLIERLALLHPDIDENLRVNWQSPLASSSSDLPDAWAISNTRRAVSMPSPVVEYSRKMMWPDCSPPSEASWPTSLRARIYRPRECAACGCFRLSSARSRPRFDMTVETTVSPRSLPSCCSARAAMSST